MIPLARPRRGPAVAEATAILALLLSSLTFPSWWWRVPVLALGVALAARLLRTALSRPSLKLDFTTLTIKTTTRTTTVHRRDVLGVVPLHAARPGAPNLRLRFRDDTTRVDLNAEHPDTAVREILGWIGKGPAKEDARHLLLTRLADALHTKIKSATAGSARRAARTRPTTARPTTAQSTAARHVPSRPAPALVGAAVGSWHVRTALLSRLAVALRSLEAARSPAAEYYPPPAPESWPSTASGVVVPSATPGGWPSTGNYPAFSPTVSESWLSPTGNAVGSSATPGSGAPAASGPVVPWEAPGTWPQAGNRPATPVPPADPMEARRLALARVAVALHAAIRSAHAATIDDGVYR